MKEQFFGAVVVAQSQSSVDNRFYELPAGVWVSS